MMIKKSGSSRAGSNARKRLRKRKRNLHRKNHYGQDSVKLGKIRRKLEAGK